MLATLHTHSQMPEMKNSVHLTSFMGSGCIKIVHATVCCVPFLSSAKLCAVELCSIEQYGAVLSCAVCAVLCCAVLCCAVLRRAMLSCAVLCCATAVCCLPRQLQRMPPNITLGERAVYAPQEPSFCADHHSCVMHNVAGLSPLGYGLWS